MNDENERETALSVSEYAELDSMRYSSALNEEGD